MKHYIIIIYNTLYNNEHYIIIIYNTLYHNNTLDTQSGNYIE